MAATPGIEGRVEGVNVPLKKQTKESLVGLNNIPIQEIRSKRLCVVCTQVLALYPPSKKYINSLSSSVSGIATILMALKAETLQY